MSASVLTDERPAIDSGYAWLISEANRDCSRHSAVEENKAILLDEFDELVASHIVKTLRQQAVVWSIRSTGHAVLTVAEQLGWFSEATRPVPVRRLVTRAHRIARQIVPESRWLTS